MTRTEAATLVVEAARKAIVQALQNSPLDGALRELDDALAAYEAATDSEEGWQPIETAPRE